jgi:2-polyprenyl-6-methoxyphenol hydroxylase-like FAD-dependent oxidoreductase
MAGETVDAVVCGAGVAGLAAGCALGRVGWRVLVVDRQPAPAPVPKGEVLQPGALRVLRGWGARERLDGTGAVPLSRLVLRDPGGAPMTTLDYDALPGGESGIGASVADKDLDPPSHQGRPAVSLLIFWVSASRAAGYPRPPSSSARAAAG